MRAAAASGSCLLAFAATVGAQSVESGAARAGAARPHVLLLRNALARAYEGPLEVAVDLPDGRYRGRNARAVVRGGRVRVVATLPAGGAVTLHAASPAATGAAPGARPREELAAGGPLALESAGALLRGSWHHRPVAELALGLVDLPGTTATVDSVPVHFRPLTLAWREVGAGRWQARADAGDVEVWVSASAEPGGWVDVETRLTRHAAGGPRYLALVRRVVTPAAVDEALRFNGRVLAGGTSPSVWDRDFWYTRGVDWIRWRAGDVSLVVANGFTPVPTIRRDSLWVEGSHFYVWERTLRSADTLWLVSEIAGPNVEQARSRYMPVTPYAPLAVGDTLRLRWRLAMRTHPPPEWAESQLLGVAGSRSVATRGDTTVLTLGVPATRFGVSYFPYSTFTENFDFRRVKGLTSESFWPTSAAMWAHWRALAPRLRTDLHIVRALGFEAIRLHHLELLQRVDSAEALSSLDFLATESRRLGLHWMVDAEGPAPWLAAIVARYRDLVTRVELENEVLIGGVTPARAARWSALYAAVKGAAPDAQVILTDAGNHGQFERLRQLGVPVDRVGLHAYKHGPQWIEAYGSHVLGTADYAASIGKPMTIGEFNWKDLTRMSPRARRDSFARILDAVLAPRVVPELYLFQLHEQLAFNPSVAGTTSRHYEPLGLDRRPKGEAEVITAMIRRYGPADAPVVMLPVTVGEARFVGGRATAPFTVRNATAAAAEVEIAPLAFDGARVRLLSPSRLRVPAGGAVRGRVALALPPGAAPGTYHHFVRVSRGGLTSIGWGVASNPGAPVFADSSVLGARVRYRSGVDMVHAIRWSRPLAVVFGTRTTTLELEQAYQLANTLQAATGRPVWISDERDLPDSLARRGTVFLVGRAATSALVASTGVRPDSGAGTIALERRDGREWVVLTGEDSRAVQAAVVELELRYWPNARDALLRLVGSEPGAALGHRIAGSAVDPP